ncbi:MAG: M48 family metalloprotease [Alphaproteobacteria bacterium]|nr:M48 family metalloprotease [Alphaproteobacteria bacterium]
MRMRMRSNPRGRAVSALALLAVLVPWIAGCATNPATGGQMLSFMSAEEEQKIGDTEHPKLVAAFGGEVTDRDLVRYVDSVGQLLARASDLPNLKYTFTLLDSDMVNAFALPGGYVHVSRGLLALANSEAELAGVLAHEIGHVTARHSAQRYSQSVLAQVGVGIVGILTGSRELANLAGSGAGLYLRGYSRDQEFQADTLGVRYLKRAGFDARAMSSFLASLRAHSQVEAQLQGLPPGKIDERDLMATHPRTVERVERAAEAAGNIPVANPIVGRDVYLRKIDGMIYGDSPSHGFARGRDFLHPELRFRFRVPERFELANGPQRVIAKGPDNALIVFDGAKRPGTRSMYDYMINVWAKGLRVDNREEVTINGLPAATGTVRARTNQGTMDLRLVAIQGSATQIWRMMFLSPTAKTQGLSQAFRETTYSFRNVSASEAATWKPWRIRLHQVRAGETAESLAARLPFEKLKVERFRALNGLGAGEALRPGQTVKLVAAGN